MDEIKWHSFYLQAAVTYDTFFDEHIIDQGTAYRYFAGFQGAIRDPLQHVLPFIHTRLVGALPSPQNQMVVCTVQWFYHHILLSHVSQYSPHIQIILTG